MKINYKLIFCLPAIICLFICLHSCEDNTAAKVVVPAMDTTGVSTSGAMKYEGEIISIPSPIEVATLIQKSNIQYNQELINDLQNKSRYLNETKKALNLGVYGADLAYIANYNLGQINNDYFNTLAGLATDLGILENIDKKIVAKLNSNLNNKDSILSLNAEFFRVADRYLKNNERSHLSSYILVGGWIESLHLTASIAGSNEELMKRLGEQKYSAKSILNMLDDLNDPAFVAIKSELTKLCEILDKLESTYTYRQPINDQREKITYLRSQSSVNLDKAEMAEISEQIRIVRNAITE